jgi:hypothetical protein
VRLQKLAEPYIARKRSEEEARAKAFASEREDYFITVANIAILTLDGDPKVGEPLRRAWERCLQSDTWQAWRGQQPVAEGNDQASPFLKEGSRSVAQYFREYILPGLPGPDETAKLNAVLAKTPPWLLWFARAELPILFLGLKLPDLSSMAGFERGEISTWYQLPNGHLQQSGLPDGAFEWCRLPEGVEDKRLGSLLARMRREPRILTTVKNEPKLTPRERLRVTEMKVRTTAVGSGSHSTQTAVPEFASVAAWLHAMSKISCSLPAQLPPHTREKISASKSRSQRTAVLVRPAPRPKRARQEETTTRR